MPLGRSGNFMAILRGKLYQFVLHCQVRVLRPSDPRCQSVSIFVIPSVLSSVRALSFLDHSLFGFPVRSNENGERSKWVDAAATAPRAAVRVPKQSRLHLRQGEPVWALGHSPFLLFYIEFRLITRRGKASSCSPSLLV